MAAASFTLEESISGSGGPAVVEKLRDFFTHNNFLLENSSPNGFTARGPGMMSSHAPWILGLSQVQVRLEGAMLRLAAEAGFARRLGRFATWFPPALGAVLAAVFSMIPATQPAFWAPLLATAPWVFIGPLMARHFLNRTQEALKVALANALTNAKSPR